MTTIESVKKLAEEGRDRARRMEMYHRTVQCTGADGLPVDACDQCGVEDCGAYRMATTDIPALCEVADMVAGLMEELEKVRQHIPETFYAGLDLHERVKVLVAGWQTAVKVNRVLEADLEEAETKLAAAMEERGEAREIIQVLRRKLAIAGVEGSPPPGGQGTIPDLLQRCQEAEAKLAAALAQLEDAQRFIREVGRKLGGSPTDGILDVLAERLEENERLRKVVEAASRLVHAPVDQDSDWIEANKASYDLRAALAAYESGGKK